MFPLTRGTHSIYRVPVRPINLVKRRKKTLTGPVVELWSSGEESWHVVLEHLQRFVHLIEDTDHRVLVLDDELCTLQGPSAASDETVGVLTAKVRDRADENVIGRVGRALRVVFQDAVGEVFRVPVDPAARQNSVAFLHLDAHLVGILTSATERWILHTTVALFEYFYISNDPLSNFLISSRAQFFFFKIAQMLITCRLIFLRQLHNA